MKLAAPLTYRLFNRNCAARCVLAKIGARAAVHTPQYKHAIYFFRFEHQTARLVKTIEKAKTTIFCLYNGECCETFKLSLSLSCAAWNNCHGLHGFFAGGNTTKLILMHTFGGIHFITTLTAKHQIIEWSYSINFDRTIIGLKAYRLKLGLQL